MARTRYEWKHRLGECARGQLQATQLQYGNWSITHPLTSVRQYQFRPKINNNGMQVEAQKFTETSKKKEM